MSKSNVFLLLFSWPDRAAAFAAPAYDESLAIADMWLNQAVSCDAGLANWTCGLPCSKASLRNVTVASDAKLSTLALTARASDDECIIVFRGSKDVWNTLEDLDFFPTDLAGCQNCKVHSGFLKDWRSLEPGVRDALDALGCGAGTVAVVGHSLGASMAALAAYELSASAGGASTATYALSRVYAYAQPRTGNAAWAAAFGARMTSLGVPHFRVVLYRDLVPHLPLDNMFFEGWTHTAPEVYYNRTGTGAGSHVTCTDVRDKTCSAQWSALQGHPCDHCSYLGMNPCDCGKTEPHCVEP